MSRRNRGASSRLSPASTFREFPVNTMRSTESIDGKRASAVWAAPGLSGCHPATSATFIRYRGARAASAALPQRGQCVATEDEVGDLQSGFDSVGTTVWSTARRDVACALAGKVCSPTASPMLGQYFHWFADPDRSIRGYYGAYFRAERRVIVRRRQSTAPSVA